MRKLIMIMLCLSFSQAYATEGESFESELKLPEAHYSHLQKKLVVKVEPDFNNSDNLQQQEQIINKLEAEVGANNLIIVETK